jgi:hypothetical protein
MQVSLVKKSGQAKGLNVRRIQKLSVASKVLLACVKEGRREKRARGGQRRSYTLRKRRQACARALPDTATAVS